MHFGRTIFSNVTIDDTPSSANSDFVTYNPPSAWNSKGTCSRGPCVVSLDENKIHSGTWHESTFHVEADNATHYPYQLLTATARFRGNAVYVYAVLPPAVTNLPPTAAVTFYIDGVLVNEFSHVPGSDYVYDFPVYANSSLVNDSHDIVIVNGKYNGSQSLFILDRIIYSASGDPPDSLTNEPTLINTIDPTSTQNNTVPTNTSGESRTATAHSPGAISGIVIGSLVGVIVISIIIFYFCHIRRNKSDTRKVSPWIPESNERPFCTPPYHWRLRVGRGRWAIAGDSKHDILIAADPPPAYENLP